MLDLWQPLVHCYYMYYRPVIHGVSFFISNSSNPHSHFICKFDTFLQNNQENTQSYSLTYLVTMLTKNITTTRTVDNKKKYI